MFLHTPKKLKFPTTPFLMALFAILFITNFILIALVGQLFQIKRQLYVQNVGLHNRIQNLEIQIARLKEQHEQH